MSSETLGLGPFGGRSVHPNEEETDVLYILTEGPVYMEKRWRGA